MKKFILLSLAVMTLSFCSGPSKRAMAIHMVQEPVTLNEVKAYALGEWVSLSTELRPTEDRTGKGKIQPTFLTRNFKFMDKDKFAGTITMYADPYGKTPLMIFDFRGVVKWGKEHPIVKGAWEIDYTLNSEFALTPKHPLAVKMLNSVPTAGLKKFQVNVKQSILKKAFPMFNIIKNQIVTDYDLIYFKNGLLFMGAKHVDGTPFDKPERRPQQLQIPLLKVYNL
ncbi:MAG: hypothetical protein AAF518_19235 [Spirochaetota bacterium]